MSLSMFHSYWTVFLFILFIAIVIWAWSGHRKQAFAEAARLPLDDEEPVATAEQSGEGTDA